MSIFHFANFQVKIVFFSFLGFLQNRRFQIVIDYGLIFGGRKSVYFYAVKKGVL
jgi:hypothetical protein